MITFTGGRVGWQKQYGATTILAAARSRRGDLQVAVDRAQEEEALEYGGSWPSGSKQNLQDRQEALARLDAEIAFLDGQDCPIWLGIEDVVYFGLETGP